ncbi:phosphatase [Plasmodium cynomolgi strain B]|uniref:Phosphatase n=1 Tax=Plasmodium cynomolgi (strain B) TaxID=1120755 RepID=K6V0W4_PLACD|nr:phosphatase [Plasmodium cynomolgi strain B]GAB68715.1 phosphatase [Plasmodium cynomolgi strain B]
MKNLTHKPKEEGENIIIKLEDNTLMEKLEYKLVPKYFLLNNDKHKDAYCLLKKTNSKKIEKDMMNGEKEKKLLKKRQGESENYDGILSLVSSHNNSGVCKLESPDSFPSCHYICEERNAAHRGSIKEGDVKKVQSRKNNKNAINQLGEQKYNLASRNPVHLTPNGKNVGRTKNENTHFRKENFVRLLRNSSKKILCSAEKVKIFKNLFLKIKRKDENFFCDSKEGADSLGKSVTGECSPPEGCVICPRGEEATEESAKEHRRDENKIFTISCTAKLNGKGRSTGRRNGETFSEDSPKNNRMKKEENDLKGNSDTVTNEKEEHKYILDNSLNDNTKKTYPVMYKDESKSTKFLEKILKEKKNRMNNLLLLNIARDRPFKPKEITKLSRLKRDSGTISYADKIPKQALQPSGDGATLEYCASDMNIKQCGVGGHERRITLEDKTEVAAKRRNEKQLGDVIRKENVNFILCKNSMKADKMDKIKVNGLHISSSNKKIIASFARRRTQKGKKEIAKVVESEEKGRKNHTDRDEYRVSQIMQYNEKCEVAVEQRGGRNHVKDHPAQETHMWNTWALSVQQNKNDDPQEVVPQEVVPQEIVAKVRVSNEEHQGKVRRTIKDAAELQKRYPIAVEQTNCGYQSDPVCKKVSDKMGKKGEDTFHFLYEQNGKTNGGGETPCGGINVKKINPLETPSQDTSIIADTVNSPNNRKEEKCSKKKLFFFEKNKLRIKNFINKNEIFNLTRKGESRKMKSEKGDMRVSHASEKFSPHSFATPNDSMSKFGNIKMVSGVNHAYNSSMFNKKIVEKKIKVEEEVLSAYPVEVSHTKRKDEDHTLMDEKRIASVEDVSTDTDVLMRVCIGNQLDGSLKHGVNVMNENDSLDESEGDPLANGRTDEDNPICEKSSNTDRSNNYTNVVNEDEKCNHSMSYDKQKLLMKDLITSVSKEKNYDNPYQQKKKVLEERKEKNTDRTSEQKCEDSKMERKINGLKRKKKKFRSYFMKFRSFLFFQNRKKTSTVATLTEENGSNKVIRKKKFHLKRKKKMKKLKSLRLLNMYSSKKMMDKSSNERAADSHCENYQTREFLLGEQREEERGRKTIVLDLDETLVHSTLRGERYNSFRIHIELGDGRCVIYVNKRPGVEHFFKEISKHYEVVIFTASLPKYANAVIDKLDKDNICAYRLFRESCTFWNNNYVKDLKILGRDLNNVVIIDNSTFVHKFCEDNCILIKSWFDDPTDKELYKLIPFLKKLSKKKSVIRELRKYNKKKRKRKF